MDRAAPLSHGFATRLSCVEENGDNCLATKRKPARRWRGRWLRQIRLFCCGQSGKPLGEARFHACGGVLGDDIGLCSFVDGLLEGRERCRRGCLLESSERIMYSLFAAHIEYVLSLRCALCLLGGTCICHSRESTLCEVKAQEITRVYNLTMIGHIEGKVAAVRGNFCIVSAGGVGYKIASTKDALHTLKEGQQVSLWTHTAVREDALDLFGFPSESDLAFFELLLTVSGIGPRSALGILNVAPANTLRSAIAAGNDTYLTNVSCIGKKTAQKILFELKDKVAVDTVNTTLRSDEDALEAMRALGYSIQEAREALKHVPGSVTGSHARLREALRTLGRTS